MNVALKEWAAVVEAIARGRQILLLRKGGLAEGGGFQLRHREFLFFPTWEHQHARYLRPECASLLAPEPPDVPIRLLARVTDVVPAPAIDGLRAAGDLFVWNDDYLRQRCDYRPDLPLHLILVRAYRLAAETRIPNRPSYAGCKSWVQLSEDIPVDGAAPALGEEEFQRLRGRLLRE